MIIDNTCHGFNAMMPRLAPDFSQAFIVKCRRAMREEDTFPLSAAHYAARPTGRRAAAGNTARARRRPRRARLARLLPRGLWSLT